MHLRFHLAKKRSLEGSVIMVFPPVTKYGDDAARTLTGNSIGKYGRSDASFGATGKSKTEKRYHIMQAGYQKLPRRDRVNA
jgi:hypothetical protein